MKSYFRGFFVALVGLAIVACACSKDEGDAPKNQPKAERYEVFKLLNPNDIPYRIPALAVTKSGTLIAVSDYRHSGTDIGVTNYGRIDLRYSLSYDNGKTWSAPELLSAQIKTEDEDFLGIGPGRGTVINYDGKERIIFAVYDNVGNGPVVHNENVSTIYSDDNGVTWHRGAETKCRTMLTKTSEAQIVELGGDKLRMFARNQGRYVAYADSTDGGHSWTKFRSDLDLPSNANCMVSFINAEVDGKQFVLGSYTSNKKNRADGVIRVGVIENGDINWINTYYINDGFFAYSCLTQLADGNIGMLYEDEADKVSYMVLTLDKDGNLSEINGNNFEGIPTVPSNEKTLRYHPKYKE